MNNEFDRAIKLMGVSIEVRKYVIARKEVLLKAMIKAEEEDDEQLQLLLAAGMQELMGISNLLNELEKHYE